MIELAGFQKDDLIGIPKTSRSSQAVALNQLQKGIEVQFKILDTLKKQENTLANLPQNIATALKSGKEWKS